MQQIPSGPTSDSNSSLSGETEAADGFSGAHEKTRNIIRKANRKIKLIQVLNSYGIDPYKRSDWSDPLICPIHKGGTERTPSFYYSFLEDRFHCFGCSTGGRAVEFLALKENIPHAIIAENIIKEFEGYDPNDEFEVEIDYAKIEELLFNFAIYLENVIKVNPDKIEHIDKLTWWFDSYLAAKIPRNRIVVEELEHRIQKVKSLLKKFENA